MLTDRYDLSYTVGSEIIHCCVYVHCNNSVWVLFGLCLQQNGDKFLMIYVYSLCMHVCVEHGWHSKCWQIFKISLILLDQNYCKKIIVCFIWMCLQQKSSILQRSGQSSNINVFEFGSISVWTPLVNIC